MLFGNNIGNTAGVFLRLTVLIPVTQHTGRHGNGGLKGGLLAVISAGGADGSRTHAGGRHGSVGGHRCNRGIVRLETRKFNASHSDFMAPTILQVHVIHADPLGIVGLARSRRSYTLASEITVCVPSSQNRTAFAHRRKARSRCRCIHLTTIDNKDNTSTIRCNLPCIGSVSRILHINHTGFIKIICLADCVLCIRIISEAVVLKCYSINL